MMPLKKCPAVCAAMFSGFILRLYFILTSHYISSDGTQYAGIGYNLLHFFNYQSNGAQFPDIVQPPLYPIFTGLFSWVFPLEYAAKFVSLLFGILLIYGIYRFALFLKADKRYALAAAWLTALHPALILVSSEAATESLYLFLVLAGFMAGWMYIKQQRPLLIMISSFIWLAAFLTRAEGIAFFVLQFFVFIFIVWKKQNGLHLLYFLLPFLFGVAVYMQFTAQELGYRTPSPKLKLVRSHARLNNLFKEELEKIPRQQQEWKVKYSLTPAGDELAANALLYRRWTIAPSAQTDVKKISFVSSQARRIIYNLKRIPMKVKNGFAFPVVFLLLLFISLHVLVKKKKPTAGSIGINDKLDKVFIFYLLFMGSGTLSFLISHVEDRFLYALIPFLIFPAAEGVMLIYNFINNKSERYFFRKYSLGFILLFIFAGFIFSYSAVAQKHQAKNYYYQAGVQLKRYVTKKDKIAAVMPQAIFYSAAKYSVLPFASLSRLLLYLKINDIPLVLLEQKDLTRLPVAKELLDTLNLQTEFSVAGNKFYLLSLSEER